MRRNTKSLRRARIQSVIRLYRNSKYKHPEMDSRHLAILRREIRK